MTRDREYDVGSAQALRSMAGSGTVFYQDKAYITSNSNFRANFVAEIIFPTDSGAFLEVLRFDVRDSPNAVNVDHYKITMVGAKAYIRNLGFEGAGHHCPDVPSSLAHIRSVF